MRIPITIKIPVNEAGHPSGLAATQAVIKDLGSGLENITVRALGIKRPPAKPTQLQTVHMADRRDLSGQYMASRFPVIHRTPVQATTARPVPRYTVKTIHITLAWPTLHTPIELWHSLARAPRKIRLRAGAIVLAVAVLVVCLQLFGGSDNAGAKTPAVASSGLPKLVRGTPSFHTVLPAGKTIDQLGGWVRISPPGKDPVYTYVDKINKVQINVSEQPLPAAFQQNSAAKIDQLAESYNATDKFIAKDNTHVYVGSAGPGNQSVIFTTDNLLVLIKSAAPITNNQWATYISSLQ